MNGQVTDQFKICPQTDMIIIPAGHSLIVDWNNSYTTHLIKKDDDQKKKNQRQK